MQVEFSSEEELDAFLVAHQTDTGDVRVTLTLGTCATRGM